MASPSPLQRPNAAQLAETMQVSGTNSRFDQARQPEASQSRVELMQRLRGQADAITSIPLLNQGNVFSTGSSLIDRWLPGNGLPLGTLCEWIAATTGNGAGTLAMIAAAQRMQDSNFGGAGPLVVVDPIGHFHALAAVACGIPCERIVWCRPVNRRDTVWTLDQALRCRSVAAVWSTLPWHLDDRDERRLQLASEQGQTPGLFVRQAAARSRPSFAAIRFHVAATGTTNTTPGKSTTLEENTLSEKARTNLVADSRPVRITLDRAPGMKHSRQVVLNIDSNGKLVSTSKPSTAQPRSIRHASTQLAEHTNQPEQKVAMRLASQLANPTSRSHNPVQAEPIGHRRVG